MNARTRSVRRAGAQIGLIGLICFGASTANATLYLGWADEFLGGRADCALTATLNGCEISNYWAGPMWLDPNVNDTNHPPTWSWIGAQSYAGRTNTKEKIIFTSRDAKATGNGSATVTLSRYRQTSIPSEGSSCGSSGTFVGSVSQTMDSGGGPVEDTKNNVRLLPVFDFGLESSSGGVAVGYRSALTITNMQGSSATKMGCYKIRWN